MPSAPLLDAFGLLIVKMFTPEGLSNSVAVGTDLPEESHFTAGASLAVVCVEPSEFILPKSAAGSIDGLSTNGLSIEDLLAPSSASPRVAEVEDVEAWLAAKSDSTPLSEAESERSSPSLGSGDGPDTWLRPYSGVQETSPVVRTLPPVDVGD
eukprot:CAMPEP_0169261064 /NCGR_PEP_ID=MMETSP1016-20121227/42867_1 /TAXON_ID=342587 /ORGANISM="Karlodinium micrum, Strain CCMP2283" /LENGTH=152 /DNA_ID=CAMNT_0009343283 /DNA_START=855 /DNA_END=1313 /DNA_ORIENTATION=+